MSTLLGRVPPSNYLTGEDEFFDKLRGKKYVYLATVTGSPSNINVVAYSEEHAMHIAKTGWWHNVDKCKDVTDTFHLLNNALTPEHLETLEPGILRSSYNYALTNAEQNPWKTI